MPAKPHATTMQDRRVELYAAAGPTSAWHQELKRRSDVYEREWYRFFRYQGVGQYEAERRAFNIATSWRHSAILDALRTSLGRESPARNERVEGGVAVAPSAPPLARKRNVVRDPRPRAQPDYFTRGLG